MELTVELRNRARNSMNAAPAAKLQAVLDAAEAKLAAGNLDEMTLFLAQTAASVIAARADQTVADNASRRAAGLPLVVSSELEAECVASAASAKNRVDALSK